MNRKRFIRKFLLSGFTFMSIPAFSILEKNRISDYTKLKEEVGYNHLPNKEDFKMNKIIHRAETRGHANHGWLNSHHTFSFANYRNSDRMNFGVLRVLNDDIVSAGQGFGKHPHDNMEIVSIPLFGDLEHKDSMGNTTVIKQGDIQVMSAGTGVFHSEFNKNADKEVRFLQIWMFPNKKDVTPRYDQLSIKENQKNNEFQQILSPNRDDEGVWVHQNAWFSIGTFTNEKQIMYELNDKSNGVYLFVLEGGIVLQNEDLSKRDGIGVWNCDKLEITAKPNTQVLLMEVPMEL